MADDPKDARHQFTMELSAEEFRQLEALALIRGITPAEVVRQGIKLMGGHRSPIPLTDEDLAQAKQASKPGPKRRSIKR